MRVVIALAVAVAAAVVVRYLAMDIALQVAPPRCQQFHGPGFHSLVCVVNFGPQLVASVVAGLVAGVLAFLGAWRVVR